MVSLKKIPSLVVCSFAFILTACGGGGGSSSSSDGESTSDGTAISGTATAPAGSVASLTSYGWQIALRDFLISPAQAAIDGLSAVEGATVELIQVDDNGDQVGDVLATAVTSISGDYNLTVPAGTSLAGNLVVRITGTGGTEMRAQVVEQDVDINPITEYVLSKFIDQGSELGSLTTASVIRLTGQVEEFDLTATSDLQTMLAALDDETGAFVEEQIDIIDTGTGDASALAGTYRSFEFALGLHDDDGSNGVGDYSKEATVLEFSLTDNGDGSADVTTGGSDYWWSTQSVYNNAWTLNYVVEEETGGDTITVQVSDGDVLNIESEFEEDIDGDYGWRWPPYVMRLQKAANNKVLLGAFTAAAVRYETTDTNDDGEKDAVDPDARSGDEVFSYLFIAADKPQSMTASDLSGDYGVVELAVNTDENGYYGLSTSNFIASFDGVGSLDLSTTSGDELERSGTTVTYTSGDDIAETDIPYSVSADGSTFTAGGEDVTSLFSSDYQLMLLHSVTTADDSITDDEYFSEVEAVNSYGVKLPDTQLDLSGKEYRLVYNGEMLSGSATALSTGRFSNTLTVNSDGLSGTLSFAALVAEKSSAAADIEADNDAEATDYDVSFTLAENGVSAMTLTDAGDTNTVTLTGYFSADGALGVFRVSSAETGSDPDQLGVAFLVAVNADN